MVECIRLYYDIEEMYRQYIYDYFELKNYYVIYLVCKFNMEIDNAPPARMLLKNKFKLLIEKKVTNKEVTIWSDNLW